MAKRLEWYRLRFRVLAGCLLACLALAYLALSRFAPPSPGSGPAGPEIERACFRIPWSSEKHVLLGLGDSITVGFGATDGRGYFQMLFENDPAVHHAMAGCDLSSVFPGLVAVNLAVNYTVSEEHLQRQVPAIPESGEDTKGVVVITSGGNDLIHDYGQGAPRDGALYGATLEQARKWAPNFKKRLTGIIEGVNGKFPGGCRIFLANIYDPTDGVGDIENCNLLLPKWPDGKEILALWNEVIAAVADEFENVHLVDIHSVFLGHGIHCRDRNNPYHNPADTGYWYYANLEDPNDRGYDALRRVFLQKMIETLAPPECRPVGRQIDVTGEIK